MKNVEIKVNNRKYILKKDYGRATAIGVGVLAYMVSYGLIQTYYANGFKTGHKYGYSDCLTDKFYED